MRRLTRLVVFPPCKPMERENTRAQGMAAALSSRLEKGTCSQTDRIPHKTRSGTESGIQSETGNRPSPSPSQKRRSQETSSHLRKTTEGNGRFEIHQKPLSSKNSGKTRQQKIRQPDSPTLVLLVFRRHPSLVRSNTCRQESSRSSRLAQREELSIARITDTACRKHMKFYMTGTQSAHHRPKESR
jgi:hypothetical protein